MEQIRKKPIYTIRRETVLAEDHIKPYGDRVEVSSESARYEMALKLLEFDTETEQSNATST